MKGALGTDPSPAGNTMTTLLLDPDRRTRPGRAAAAAQAVRPSGLTVGLLDISKARGDVFLDRIAARLSERGIAVKRYKKPTFTRPAPLALIQTIATEVDVVVEGLAD